MADWGIYGGAGFIGQHFAHSILSKLPADRVILLDIQSWSDLKWKVPLESFLATARISLINVDVRDIQQVLEKAKPFDIIVNLAAVHCEPGHRPEEYFETNVSGARNVCQMAKDTGCQEIIFTSSISVYGVHDHPVDEHSLLQPKTPYGQSKLEAENIHQAWSDRTGGRLSIIRPGVVFGPGENGNVTRLVRESLKRGRAIQLEPDQPKAGIYIEELLNLIHWLRLQPLANGEFQLANGVSNENLSFNDFGKVLQKLQRFEKKPIKVSVPLLKVAILLMKPLGLVLPATSKLHPVRLSKLTRANDIHSAELSNAGYSFTWPLEKALADWIEKGL